MGRFTVHVIPTEQAIRDAQARVASLQSQLEAAKAEVARLESEMPLGKLVKVTEPKPKKTK